MNIAIVGGGVIGLTIAWRLSQQGDDITIFEKQQLGGEASWAAAGMLAPGGEVSEPSEYAQLLLESRTLYPRFIRELEAESAQRIDFQESGALDLAYSDVALEHLNRRATRQAGMGIVSDPITPARVQRNWPQLRGKDLVGARFYPNDGFVDVRHLIPALKRACERRDVTLREWSPVRQLSLEAAAVTVTVTSQQPERFDAAVLAAGAWSSDLPITCISPPPPPVEPVKGHLIGYHQPLGACPCILRQGETYLLQRANGLLIAGASMERAGFDRGIQPAIVAELHNQAVFLLPALAHASPPEAWVGFRPKSEQLQLQAAPTGPLYFAYGHFRNGILLAPLTADRIVRMLRDR